MSTTRWMRELTPIMRRHFRSVGIRCCECWGAPRAEVFLHQDRPSKITCMRCARRDYPDLHRAMLARPKAQRAERLRDEQLAHASRPASLTDSDSNDSPSPPLVESKSETMEEET